MLQGIDGQYRDGVATESRPLDGGLSCPETKKANERYYSRIKVTVSS